MKARLMLGVFAVALSLTLASCGTGSSTVGGPTEVKVTETEYKIESALTTFKTGVPYRFAITNAGQAAHDWMIMPPGEKDEDKSLIKVEDADLKPGTTVTKEYTFKNAGSFEFACHVGDHYDRGMKMAITVQ